MNKNNLRLLILVTTAVVTAKEKLDPVDDQIELFRLRNPVPVGTLTTSAGRPIDYSETNTLNKRLLFNEFFMESITHLSRERIPERVVHAKGAGAFGYFEVTDDISGICKANFLDKVGKRTSVAVRFSPLVTTLGGSDTTRETRGFAIKFYTEEGNWDLVGLNFPVFELKDPLLFPSFIHAMNRNPATNLFDQNMFWDVFTLHPESLFLLLRVYADAGIPDGFRHMPGFSIHTYQLVNEHGESYFVRFHFMPDAGIKNIFSEEAKQIGADDPDYATRDLYEAIAKGRYPSWTCYVQVLTLDDVKNADFDVFDITRVLPMDKYPLQRFGKLVLTKNPTNFFAEIEQLAFCPGNLVPGVLGAPDKVFEARRLSYRDAQFYRLGDNFMKIAVNCPVYSKLHTYDRDGVAPVKDNERDTPNYYPNSFNGPVPYVEKNRVELIQIIQDQPYNLDQARDFYHLIGPDEQQRLVENIVSSLRLAVTFLQERAVKMFSLVDSKFGRRVLEGLKANRTRCYDDL